MVFRPHSELAFRAISHLPAVSRKAGFASAATGMKNHTFRSISCTKRPFC